MSAVAENGEYIFLIWELFMFHWYKKLEIDNILYFIIIQIVINTFFSEHIPFFRRPSGLFPNLFRQNYFIWLKFPNSVNSIDTISSYKLS